MAKINNFIAEFREGLEGAGIPVGQGNMPKTVCRRFLMIFRGMDDSRVQGMIDYPLEEIVLIALLAVLGGASTWTEMATFGEEKKRWLKKFMPLRNGIPSHDTFRRVFSLIRTEQLEKLTVDFLVANLTAIRKALGITGTGYRHICVDGKEQRGTGRNYDCPGEKTANLQTLHVYDASNSICLHSRAVNEKTNEIPVAQDILKCMDLKGCIVTFDALHMQKDTISVIADAKGEYVGGLKGNQGSLQDEAARYFDDECRAFYKEKGDYYHSTEKARGKIEKRCYYLVRPFKSETARQWKKLKAFVCCETFFENIKTGKKSTEVRYYAASIDDISLCVQAIRGHWQVENSLHWHLDTAFYEDDNSTMDKTAFHNFSMVNKLALSLCKLAKAMNPRYSIRVMRKSFGWNYEENLEKLLSFYDDNAIAEAMKASRKSLKGVRQT